MGDRKIVALFAVGDGLLEEYVLEQDAVESRQVANVKRREGLQRRLAIGLGLGLGFARLTVSLSNR